MELSGLYVPLVTPFTEDGELAPDALEKLAHDVIKAGASGLVALGTTGEPATLTAAERRTVLDVCARVCRERAATLIAGAGSNDTASTARAVRDLAAWPQVSAALTVLPYYTRPSQDGIIAHFTRVAADSPVPLIMYNIPYRAGVSATLQTLRELARIPGIAGIKHAVGGVDHDTVLLMADPPEHFAVLAGDDMFASPLLALGAAGGILASAHVRTGEFAALIAAWRGGDAARARRTGSAARPAVRGPVRRAQPGRHQGRAALPGQDPQPGGPAAAAARQRRFCGHGHKPAGRPRLPGRRVGDARVDRHYPVGLGHLQNPRNSVARADQREPAAGLAERHVSPQDRVQRR